MRHGKAARTESNGSQSLTSRGTEDVKLVAKYFKRQHLPIDALWHSPKTRAVQTAELFMQTLSHPSLIAEINPGLNTDGNAQEIFNQFEKLKSGSLLVISHLPLIEELTSLLDSSISLSFPPGGLAAFQRKNGNWKLLWNLEPSSLK